MDDWMKQLEATLAQLVDETEQWVSSAVETVVESSDAIAEDLEQLLAPMMDPLRDDLERNLDDFVEAVEPWADSMVVNIGTWVEQAMTPINQVLDPLVQQRTHCVGCRNYHGQMYGDQELVCAIHPFGPDLDREACPDYASIWPDRP